MKKPLSARFGYVVSLAVALIAAAALGGAVTYGAAAALLLLPAAALLLAWRAERQLSVRHALDCENCLRGGAARYAVQLRNTGFIPVTWVSARFASSRGGQNADRPSGAGFGPEKERDSLSGESAVFEVSLAPFHTFRHETLFTPPHRGVYALSVESVRVSDPFRLTTLSGRRPETLTLTVMPRLIPISEAWKQRLDPQGAGGIFSQSSDEPAVDSRTYRYGDSPRRIHWNLTARRRELMVRQYESIESRRLLVALDLSPFTADDPEACEDALIEACLSVVRYAHERQIDTTFVYAQGKSLRSHAGRGARVFSEIHSEMAKVTFTADIPLLHLLDEAKRAQMVYLFCAKVPDGETLSALPQDKPVELAVVRTGKGKTPLPDSLEMMRVTELNP